MEKLLQILITFGLRHRKKTIVTILVVTIFFGYFASQQRFDTSYDIWFPPDDANLISYRELTKRYGKDDIIILSFRDPEGIFTPKALQTVHRLTQGLELIPYVDKVDSVTNFQHISARINEEGEDELRVADLVETSEMPLTHDELSLRLQTALSQKMIVRQLLSEDGKTTVVSARIFTEDDTTDRFQEVILQIQSLSKTETEKTGYRFYISGGPAFDVAFTEYAKKETQKYVPILFITVMILLLLFFRNLWAAFIPLMVVFFTITITMGAYQLTGIRLNNLTSIAPQVLIAIGIADALHLVCFYLAKTKEGLSSNDAIATTLRANLLPCFITSMTTALGFVSLLSSNLVPIYQFGQVCALGVVVAFLISIFLIPALLPLIHSKKGVEHHSWARSFLDFVANLAQRKTKRVLLFGILLFLGLCAFIPRIRTETSSLELFHERTEIRQAFAFLEENLGGNSDIEISLDSTVQDGVKSPLFLRRLKALQDRIDQIPEITFSLSVVDILERMNEVMNNEDPEFYRIPDNQNLNAQYLLLYTLSSRKEDLKDRIDIGYRHARLSARLVHTSSRRVEEITQEIEAFAKTEMPEYPIQITGKTALYATMRGLVKKSLFTSLFIAFLTVTIVIGFTYRSWKIGLLSMIPNILPVFITLGIMGLFGIHLDPGTAIVACVALGIAVDDTVHFLTKFLFHTRNGADTTSAIRQTFYDAGEAMTFTTTVLVIGFGLFIFSGFRFLNWFGTLAGTMIALALFYDLFFLPALLQWFTQKGKKQSFLGIKGST